MGKIQWYIDNKEINDYYAGSNIDTLTLHGSVWNNRDGDTAIDDMKNPTIICKYRTIEDTALINHTEIEILNKDSFTISKTKDSIIAKIKDPLLGIVNNGDESVINNRSFIRFKITIDLKDEIIKEDDLKELYLEIQ